MDTNITAILAGIILLCIIKIKFNPRLDKVEDNYSISYIMYYTIKGNYNEDVRDYFILYKYKK